MDVHLITTDQTSFKLLESVNGALNVTSVIVPANRRHTRKVARVVQMAECRKIPVYIHPLRSRFSRNLPPACAAICWLYSQIICEQDLARYPMGILNMHGGKLPQYRGASVLQWAIINGESECGVSWHRLIREVDAGPIYVEGRIPITPESTGYELRQAMILEAMDLFPKAWRRFLQSESTRVPDILEGKVWPQRTPLDSCIKDELTERELRDFVRALCEPWPRPFVVSGNSRVEIDRVVSEYEPGAIPYQTSDGRKTYLIPINN